MRAAVAAALLLLCGCATGPKGAASRPAADLTVDAAEPHFFSDTRGALVLRMHVRNDSSWPQKVKQARFELQLSGRYFASGAASFDEEVAPKSVREVVLQFPLAYTRTPLSPLPKTIPVAVRGAISGTRGAGEFDERFEWSGQVLEEPALELQRTPTDED